jgi:hypothetical protein
MPNRTLRARRLTGSRLVLATVLGFAFSVMTAAPSYAATGTIRIIQGGTGAGTVTSAPAGIDCHIDDVSGPAGACIVAFEEGTKVRLKAVADEGSKFVGWAPANSCPKTSIRVEAGATYECQPVFEPR